jgi:hypothetical protein
VQQSEIDKANKDKNNKTFPKGFHVEVFFNTPDADAAPSSSSSEAASARGPSATASSTSTSSTSLTTATATTTTAANGLSSSGNLNPSAGKFSSITEQYPSLNNI